MDVNLIIEDPITGKQNLATEPKTENAIEERIAALELQLRVYKQAETIGEIGHWQINLNSFETWYSENIFRLYGFEPYSVKAHPDTFTPFIHPEDREVVINIFDKSYLEKIPIHLEYRILRQDGEERHLNVVICRLKLNSASCETMEK